MPRPRRLTSTSASHASEPRDAILVLLDVVEYTPQARAAGGPATQAFDAYFASELHKRAQRHGFRFIKSVGDAALLWGENPAGLVGLMCDLFKDDPIRPHAGFTPRLRMLAHKDFFTFTEDARGRVVDVHGLEGILLFRLEKTAHLNRVIVTPHLFGGLRHLLGAVGVEFQAIELPYDLKGVGTDSPRQVYLLRPPLAEETQDFELPQPYRAARATLKDAVQFIPDSAGSMSQSRCGKIFCISL